MTTPPLFPVSPGTAKLARSQIEAFERDGLLAFHDVLAPHEVDAARAALQILLRDMVADARTGAGVETKPGWLKRNGRSTCIQFEKNTTPDPLRDDPDLELKVRKFFQFQGEHPALDGLIQGHPRIQGIVEQIVQEPALAFQTMALVKPPFIGEEKPWHQDSAYFAYVPLDKIVGVWIALDDAKVSNGCMHVLAGQHRTGPRRHHHTFDCEIIPERLDPAGQLAVELPAGSAMFFHSLLPHQTPANASPDRRRALQFHYRAASTRQAPRAEYDRIFCEPDGTPASCAAAS